MNSFISLGLAYVLIGVLVGHAVLSENEPDTRRPGFGVSKDDFGQFLLVLVVWPVFMVRIVRRTLKARKERKALKPKRSARRSLDSPKDDEGQEKPTPDQD